MDINLCLPVILLLDLLVAQMDKKMGLPPQKLSLDQMDINLCPPDKLFLDHMDTSLCPSDNFPFDQMDLNLHPDQLFSYSIKWT